MLSKIGRGVLLFSSYTPLFVIIGLRFAASNFTLAVTFVAVGLLSGVAMLVLLWWSRTIQPTPVRVTSSSSASEDVIAYLFTYLVPILDATKGDASDVFAFVILFITIGLVFLNSNLGLVNPMLAGAGFHLHRVETPGKRTYVILSRSDIPPKPGADVRVRRLSNQMGLAEETREERELG